MQAKTNFLHAMRSLWPQTSEESTAPQEAMGRKAVRELSRVPHMGEVSRCLSLRAMQTGALGSLVDSCPEKGPVGRDWGGPDINRCRARVYVSRRNPVWSRHDTCFGAVLDQTRRVAGREICRWAELEPCMPPMWDCRHEPCLRGTGRSLGAENWPVSTQMGGIRRMGSALSGVDSSRRNSSRRGHRLRCRP